MILITGGAGFIGSYLQAALVRRGLETVVVDTLGSEGKWRNLAAHPPTRMLPPQELDGFLAGYPPVEMVFDQPPPKSGMVGQRFGCCRRCDPSSRN